MKMTKKEAKKLRKHYTSKSYMYGDIIVKHIVGLCDLVDAQQEEMEEVKKRIDRNCQIAESASVARAYIYDDMGWKNEKGI